MRKLTAQSLASRVVRHMLKHDAFSRWLRIRLISIKPEYCALSMKVRKEMLNGFYVCHGGIPFSLADSALAFASNTNGNVTLSIDNGITYPAPIKSGDTLKAVARRQGGGKRINMYAVTVTNQRGQKVALFRGTVYRTDRPHF